VLKNQGVGWLTPFSFGDPLAFLGPSLVGRGGWLLVVSCALPCVLGFALLRVWGWLLVSLGVVPCVSVSFGGSMSAFSLASLAVVGPCSPVRRPVAYAWASSAVVGARLALRMRGHGSTSSFASHEALAERLAILREGFVAARRSGLPPARLAVVARVGRMLAAAVAADVERLAVCPLASGGGLPAFCLGVPSSGFRPACDRVAVVRSWSVKFGELSVYISGFALPFVCLAGGLSGLAFDALVDAVRVAERDGVDVLLWAAPGRSGRVCAPRAGSAGYFCGVSAA